MKIKRQFACTVLIPDSICKLDLVSANMVLCSGLSSLHWQQLNQIQSLSACSLTLCIYIRPRILRCKWPIWLRSWQSVPRQRRPVMVWTSWIVMYRPVERSSINKHWYLTLTVVFAHETGTGESIFECHWHGLNEPSAFGTLYLIRMLTAFHSTHPIWYHLCIKRHVF